MQRTQAQMDQDKNKIRAITDALKSREYSSQYMFVKVVSVGFANGTQEPATSIDIDWVKFCESVAKLPNSQQYVDAVKTFTSIDPELLKQILSTVMTFGYKAAGSNLEAYSNDLKSACVKAGIKLG